MGGLFGPFLGVAAVLTGSPVYILVRILRHSSAWTQVQYANRTTSQRCPPAAAAGPAAAPPAARELTLLSPSPSLPLPLCRWPAVSLQIACRSVFFVPIMLLVAVLRWRTPSAALLHFERLGWLGLAGCLFLAGQSFCIVTALRLTTVANVALLINTSPAFTATLDYFFLSEPLASPQATCRCM